MNGCFHLMNVLFSIYLLSFSRFMHFIGVFFFLFPFRFYFKYYSIEMLLHLRFENKTKKKKKNWWTKNKNEREIVLNASLRGILMVWIDLHNRNFTYGQPDLSELLNRCNQIRDINQSISTHLSTHTFQLKFLIFNGRNECSEFYWYKIKATKKTKKTHARNDLKKSLNWDEEDGQVALKSKNFGAKMINT